MFGTACALRARLKDYCEGTSPAALLTGRADGRDMRPREAQRCDLRSSFISASPMPKGSRSTVAPSAVAPPQPERVYA